ncbi:MdtA/MuxA family multidrug efflux RND transporter periplasmic adaptor subunit [Fundidesulfovibrio butyratiphilus]
MSLRLGSSRSVRIVFFALLCLGGAVLWRFFAGSSPVTAQPPGGARRAPVLAAQAQRKDVPLYLVGLGTVTPERTVTVRSRVDGELQKVFFTEGQVVKQGDPLARIDPRPFEAQITQAAGQLARDQALLANARLDLARYKGLAANEFIAKQQYDTQLALVRQYEGQVKNDQGVLENAKLQLVYSRIAAPVSGRVGLRLVDPGNMVRATDTGGLVVITQLEPIGVVFSIAEDNLPRVRQALAAGHAPSVEAFDREQKVKLAQGQLASMDNQVDLSTGTVKLKAAFANADHALFPNQFVNARLLAEVRKDAVVVPAQAVQRGPRGAFVYVVEPDDTVSFRTVAPGETSEGQTIVNKGLEAGETVVVDGADRLRDKAPVEVRQSGQSQSEGQGRPAGRTSDRAPASNAKPQPARDVKP